MDEELGCPMRSFVHCGSICFLVITICIGCSRNEDAKGKAVLKPRDPKRLTADADYYFSLPPQGRPTDGTLPAGTVVRVLADQNGKLAGNFFVGPDGARGFFLVRTDDGFEAYIDVEGIVSAKDVKQSNDPGEAFESIE